MQSQAALGIMRARARFSAALKQVLHARGQKISISYYMKWRVGSSRKMKEALSSVAGNGQNECEVWDWSGIQIKPRGWLVRLSKVLNLAETPERGWLACDPLGECLADQP